MKETKRRMETFSFYNQTAICDHLSHMAQKGWMIEKIGSFFWYYRRTEPKNLHFSACYYPKASVFDPEPTEGERSFQDFCAHTGWVLACASAQLQIFYNEQPNPIPIETEPALEVETIHSTARKTQLPSYYLLLAVGLLQGVMFCTELRRDLIGLLSNPTRLFTGLCWLLMIALCAVELISYHRWHKKAGVAAEQGNFLNPPDTRGFQKAVLAVMLLGLLYWVVNNLLGGDRLRFWLTLVMLGYFVLIFAAASGTRDFLKRKKVSRAWNRGLTLALCVALPVLLMSGITAGVLWADSRGLFADSEEETYEYRGMTWVLHQDELPLTVEELLGTEEEPDYIRERQDSESIFLGQLVLRQHPRFDSPRYADLPRLDYTVTIVKLPGLYGLCKAQLLGKDAFRDGEYVPVPAGPWGAKEAYRLYDAEFGPRNDYLLCYDHVLAAFQPDWELTEGQMALIGEKLGQ